MTPVTDGVHYKHDDPAINQQQEAAVNGVNGADGHFYRRSIELSKLLEQSIHELISFVAKSDEERLFHETGASLPERGTALINQLSLDPEVLHNQIPKSLRLCDEGLGLQGFNATIKDILNYSINPSAPGFMDKLYSAPLPPGIVSELILAVLNTNVHVYHVSPVLTLVEKIVTKRLAALFGLNGPRAGGISVQGGSASNMTSIVVARNVLFPDTKTHGNSANGLKLVMFTSAHGHYSIEKAAQGLGFGTLAVISVSTDTMGRMSPDELERKIFEAKSQGKTPFYVNATAGTTVLGSFDQFEQIASITRKHRCWLHVDGAWGGSFAFSNKADMRAKLKGCELADSIAINPHKMLGVPVTCSFLLTRDLRMFQQAMTLKAGYLFHEPEDNDSDIHNGGNDTFESTKDSQDDHTTKPSTSWYDLPEDDSTWTPPIDLADMTLQCGRKGDALKLFLSWQYYGTSGYANMIEQAYALAIHLNTQINSCADLTLVLGPDSTPSCLQVCFYYTPAGAFVFGVEGQRGIIQNHTAKSKIAIGKLNTRVTSRISRALVPRGFMVDFAPALAGQEDRGAFLRVVVNISTGKATVDRLVKEVLEVGVDVMKELVQQFEEAC